MPLERVKFSESIYGNIEGDNSNASHYSVSDPTRKTHSILGVSDEILFQPIIG